MYVCNYFMCPYNSKVYKNMRSLVIFAAIVLVVHASSDAEKWEQFKNEHGKTYKSLREEKLRYQTFQANLRKIEEHNAKYENGEESYYLGVTTFADMSSEEFRDMLKLSQAAKPNLETTDYELESDVEAPDSIDWRSKNAVLDIKNQGNCGSCWSFSATGALEGQNAIKHGKRIPLSEQNLMDCSSHYGNNGCKGGLMEYAYSYIQANGIETESNYPYTAKDGVCRFDKSKSVLTVTGFKRIWANENSLKSAVANVGPVSIAIDASFLQLYNGGVFNHAQCSSTRLNHGVLAVGYGTQNNLEYWLVKNSWGPAWGESGYVKMIRNARNQCGVATDATYPIIA